VTADRKREFHALVASVGELPTSILEASKPAPRRARERATGRYGFEGDWERLCTCGHTLGHHLAEAPHGCIESDFADVECDCERFRPAKRTKKGT
jgi:hypothetical protein